MSGNDRLKELQLASSADESFAPEDNKQSTDIAEYVKQFDSIKLGLKLIKENVAKVQKLKAQDKKETKESKRAEIMASLDKIISETNRTASQIKKKLDEINKENVEYQKNNKESAKTQMRQNLYQNNIRHFHSVMSEYNGSVNEFKQNLQDFQRRQLKYVDNKEGNGLNDEQIEKIIESGQANEFIKKALVSDDLKDVVAEIEQRHLDIVRLAQQVAEVAELFKDLAALVDMQQESLDVIEGHVMNSGDYIHRGELELREAEDYAKKARQRQCCIVMILLGILTAIVAPILATQLNKA